MTKKLLFFLILLFFLFSFITPHSVAHSTGASFEQEVNGYLVDIEYDPEEITTGTPVAFDFDILDSESGNRVEFSDVWVRIKQGEQTLFATGIHKQNLGGATLLQTFGEPGSYELIVRYQNNGEEVTSATFPFEVNPGEGSARVTSSAINLALLGIIAGLVSGHLITAFLILKNRQKTKVQ